MACSGDAADDSRMPEKEPEADDRPAPLADAFLERAAEALFGARTILVYGAVNTQLARTVSAQLLALSTAGTAPIRMIVHSQGGHVEAADTIHDLVRAITPEVIMIGSGWVASAGALIYASAKKERRYALPNTRFLLHQPLGGMSGSASDVEIEVKQIVETRERLTAIFAGATGQAPERVARDTERNFWMTAKEARDYGLVHRIIDRLADAA